MIERQEVVYKKWTHVETGTVLQGFSEKSTLEGVLKNQSDLVSEIFSKGQVDEEDFTSLINAAYSKEEADKKIIDEILANLSKVKADKSSMQKLVKYILTNNAANLQELV